MTNKEVVSCLAAINKFWDRLVFDGSSGAKSSIELPHRFVAPSASLFHGDQFYWDSYFIVVGLVADKQIELAKGMVDNLIYLQQKYGFVPMRNRQYDTGISQPPFLSSMVKEIYKQTKDKHWLSEALTIVEAELNDYWRNSDKTDHITDHEVYKSLSRYADHHLVDQTAEHESGWDMTSRFHNRALSFLPVDLNSLLYKYEIDLAQLFTQIDDTAKAEKYKADAKARQHTMTKLMWDSISGFWYDFNYENSSRDHFKSLAGFFPMWAGLATKEQAEQMIKALDEFEQPGGLAATLKDGLITPFRQWDYPNGWPPLQWIIIEGLLNYGYEKEAKNLAKKWIGLVTTTFIETGRFWEKYDVVNQTKGRDGRYPTQYGFGWTNALYIKLVKLFEFDK